MNTLFILFNGTTASLIRFTDTHPNSDGPPLASSRDRNFILATFLRSAHIHTRLSASGRTLVNLVKFSEVALLKFTH